MALCHGSIKLMPAEIKLSEGGDKDQIAFSLLPHFPSLNADFYHCAYAVRSHGGKMFLSLCFCFFGVFGPLRITLETLLAQATQKVVTPWCMLPLTLWLVAQHTPSFWSPLQADEEWGVQPPGSIWPRSAASLFFHWPRRRTHFVHTTLNYFGWYLNF